MITVFLLILGALIIVALLLRLTHRPDSPQQAAPQPQPQPQPEEECCGQHQVCERDSLLAAVSERPEYFDDEELDRFAGRQADDYTAADTDEFREVLLSLMPDDVAPWARSIQLRGIELPAPVRDELLLIITESRTR